MNLLDLFRHHDAATNVENCAWENRTEIVSRYKKLRAVGVELNQLLVERLSKSMLDEGAKNLGILRKGVWVLNSEDELSVVMDYCLYDVRRQGRNVIEQYLIDSAPDSDSDEMIQLRAMQHAIYSLFVIESVERGIGVVARDLLSNETHLVIDMGLGSSADPGLVLASRLLFHDDFSITGGAVLPVGVLSEGQRDAITKNLAKAVERDDDGNRDPAPMIQSCLSQGSSLHISYQEPDIRSTGKRQEFAEQPTGKVGRNTLCPCGSGKKFKKCCMK